MGNQSRSQPAHLVSRLKLFGERNTGTNYLEALLADNVYCAVCPGNLSEQRRLVYKVLHNSLPYQLARKIIEANRDTEYHRRFEDELGWKHARIPNLPNGLSAYPDGTGFIALVKNPYAWLLSMHKRPYQNENLNEVPFSDFIRRPWFTVGREHSGVPYYQNAVQMWNDKVGSYLNLKDYGPSLIVRYEDVLRSPEDFIERVASTFRVSKALEIVSPGKSTKEDGRTTADIASYYLEERWRAKLQGKDVEYINGILDSELVSRMGYGLISPVAIRCMFEAL